MKGNKYETELIIFLSLLGAAILGYTLYSIFDSTIRSYSLSDSNQNVDSNQFSLITSIDSKKSDRDLIEYQINKINREYVNSLTGQQVLINKELKEFEPIKSKLELFEFEKRVLEIKSKIASVESLKGEVYVIRETNNILLKPNDYYLLEDDILYKPKKASIVISCLNQITRSFSENIDLKVEVKKICPNYDFYKNSKSTNKNGIINFKLFKKQTSNDSIGLSK